MIFVENERVLNCVIFKNEFKTKLSTGALP